FARRCGTAPWRFERSRAGTGAARRERMRTLMTTETQLITVRFATKADVPAMTAAKLEAGTAAWPHIFPAEVLSQLGFPERWSTAVVDPPQRTRALVAGVDGAVVGCAIVRPSADDDASPETGELDGFYTAPAAWGRCAGLATVTTRLEEVAQER